MDLQLKNKKALVMGASQGLGRACAQGLINEGVNVVISSRTRTTLENVSQEIGASGFVCCDLSQKNEARNATLEAIKLLGGLDILITNTGGPHKGNFLEVSVQQWQHDFQSLWMSVVESLEVALPIMTAQHYGRIIMVTSIAGLEPLPSLTTSNGLRAGLEGLSKSVALEYAHKNITSNILRPGYTNTDRLKQLNLSDHKIREMVPMGRLGEPSELADLATFLSSPKASYITGQCISIDGGVTRSH